MKKIRLSEKEFWAILRKNAGIYARTARAISDKYDIEYSRQAVRDRALKKPQLYEDIIQESLDVAEESLRSLMFSKNERIRFNAIEFFLRTKGRERGYVEKSVNEITGKDGKDLYASMSDEDLEKELKRLVALFDD
jgi:hypothetical protein